MTFIMRVIFSTILVHLLATVLLGAGVTAFPITKEVMDPRALALGNAQITLKEFPGGVCVNPASPSGANRSAFANYANHFLDLWSASTGVSFPIETRFNAGLYYNSFSYGEFEESEIDIGKTGETFTAHESIIAGFFSGNWGERVDYGASLKYIWGALEEENASALAGDLGIIWDTQIKGIVLGFSVRNLGSQFSGYGSDTDPLPTEYLFGGSRKLAHLPLTLHLVSIFTQDDQEDWKIDWSGSSQGIAFAAGGEFEISNELGKPLFLRIGYRSLGQGLQTGHRLDTLAGFSFGFGVQIRMISVDYVFAPLGALGDIHRFGIVSSF